MSKNALIGPYSRKDKFHLDETILIRDYIGENKKGVMVDVGAHHGYATMPFLEKGWRVYAFEPDPDNRIILKKMLSGKSGVSVSSNAVSDISGLSLPFYASEESTGISSLSAFREGHREVCHVETITLQDFCIREEISKIDFLKIDTEGFDLMVLKGVPWDKFLPDIIECEFEDLKTLVLGYNFHDIAKYLHEKGYHVYVSEWHQVIRYGITHDWNQLLKYPCDLSSKYAWGNLLAFKNTPDEELIISILSKLLNKKKTVLLIELLIICGGGERFTIDFNHLNHALIITNTMVFESNYV